jgi:hypothetical protein
MYRGGTIPGRTQKGLRFYLSPDDPGVLPLTDWERLHDYQLCYWYCLEIERRAEQYRHLYHKNDWLWAETSLEEISTMTGLKRVINDLELPRLGLVNWLRYFHNRRRKVNPTLTSKRAIELPSDLVSLEEQVTVKINSVEYG